MIQNYPGWGCQMRRAERPDLLRELSEEQTSKITQSHPTELCLDTLRELLVLPSLPISCVQASGAPLMSWIRLAQVIPP